MEYCPICAGHRRLELIASGSGGYALVCRLHGRQTAWYKTEAQAVDAPFIKFQEVKRTKHTVERGNIQSQDQD